MTFEWATGQIEFIAQAGRKSENCMQKHWKSCHDWEIEHDKMKLVLNFNVHNLYVNLNVYIICASILKIFYLSSMEF